jgi:hypothetical protein
LALPDHQDMLAGHVVGANGAECINHMGTSAAIIFSALTGEMYQAGSVYSNQGAVNVILCDLCGA